MLTKDRLVYRMERENKQVLPKIIWEEHVATHHVGNCTLQLCMLAIACAMRINEALWDVMGA